MHRLGTPGMACDLWGAVSLRWGGASPLDENEGLKEGSLPTVTPIDQVPDEGNCGRVTDRGEEARECAVKLTINRRRQPHSRQSCEVTNRNRIQGRGGQVSEPIITKPSSFIRSGKSGTCAATVTRLIQGDPSFVSAGRACSRAGRAVVNTTRGRRKSAEVVVLSRHTPLTTGRTEQ